MNTLTIRLPDELKAELQKLSQNQNKPVSDVVRESIRRYVAIEKFRAIRNKVLPFAEARGYFDTNVIIAAFAARGLCESIMEVCLSEHELLLRDELLEEILRNLRRKIKLSAKIVNDIGDLLLEQASMINPALLAPDIGRDPNDVKILGLAVDASANYIVTGNKDLLVLKTFQDIPILNPRAFSNILHSEEE